MILAHCSKTGKLRSHGEIDLFRFQFFTRLAAVFAEERFEASCQILFLTFAYFQVY